MIKSIVALLPCRGYNETLVYENVKKGFDLLGGVEKFVSTNEKILIKPNLLKSAVPEKAITTHPSVFGALLRCLKEADCNNLSYGDSSGFHAEQLEKTVVTAGLKPQADKYDVKLDNFLDCVNVSYPDGKVCKKFAMCKAVVEADALISVCKMKTHALENITGALKNQYGCICGANKAVGHAKFPNSKSFADMLCDLDRCINPRLYIMDGILAMEGNGPGSGDPIYMNVILMSDDPIALDSVFAKLIYLDPNLVPTCTSGEKAGIGTIDFKRISIVTPNGEISADEAAEKYGNPDFNVNRKRAKFWRMRSLLPKIKKYSDKPVVDLNKCIACGICEDACPVDGKAVHSGKGQKASYDYKKCIRCYCCQEMCPAKAISRK